MTEIIDTNVILIANRQHPGVSDACVVSCMIRLERIMNDGRIAIDEAFRVLGDLENTRTKRRPMLESEREISSSNGRYATTLSITAVADYNHYRSVVIGDSLIMSDDLTGNGLPDLVLGGYDGDSELEPGHAFVFDSARMFPSE